MFHGHTGSFDTKSRRSLSSGKEYAFSPSESSKDVKLQRYGILQVSGATSSYHSFLHLLMALFPQLSVPPPLAFHHRHQSSLLRHSDFPSMRMWLLMGTIRQTCLDYQISSKLWRKLMKDVGGVMIANSARG